jgi:hypothetical protein
VQAVITGKADLGWDGSGFSVTALHEAAALATVREDCGFELGDSTEGSIPPGNFFELLERIDPSRVRDLEAGVRA